MPFLFFSTITCLPLFFWASGPGPPKRPEGFIGAEFCDVDCALEVRGCFADDDEVPPNIPTTITGDQLHKGNHKSENQSYHESNKLQSKFAN